MWIIFLEIKIKKIALSKKSYLQHTVNKALHISGT